MASHLVILFLTTVLLLAILPSTLGLYLGFGGVVGSSSPRHQITARTGPTFPQVARPNYYAGRGSSSRGRIIDYGVIYGNYQPSGIVPFSSKG